MSDNKDLTILLTLWDRVPYTFRWMEYANSIKFPFKVLIADGGADESVPQILADQANFPNVDYKYIRYPYDQTLAHYHAKVVDALNHVETPFVVMADNDDFYLVDSLLRSVDFLKTHPDFSSCRGIIGGFRITPDADYGELSNVYGRDVSFVRQVYPDKSNLKTTAVERVQDYFSWYRPNWYDVFRTEQRMLTAQVWRDANMQDLILSQHIPMLMGIIAGKVQIEPYLYLVRQLEGESSVDRIETKQKADLFDRMLLESWSEDFTGFVNAMASAISQKDGIQLDEARRIVKQGYRTLVTPGIISCLLESAPSRSALMTERVSSYMGTKNSILRKLYSPIRRMMKGRSNGIGHQYIPAAQLSATDNDFKRIYDFLATPPQSIKDPQRTQLRGSLEYSSS
jgi:glycosyltransferase domain-containing protein